MTIKVLHISDLHYAPSTLSKVEPCMAHVMAEALIRQPDVVICTGDATDHAVDAHSPAFGALARRFHEASMIAPVVVLQGTFSHEPKGLVDLYPLVSGTHPILAMSRISQAALMLDNTWVQSNSWCFEAIPTGARLIVSAVPTMNKADVAASTGAAAAGEAVGEAINDVLRGFAPIHLAARELGVPTVVISHGTVNGCLTEHDVPMAGLDHEFNVGGLFSAEASAVMLGHIHKHQGWEEFGRWIAYAGSLTRLHHGEVGDKGALYWSLEAGSAAFEQIVTPTRKSITVEFAGLPDLEQLRANAAELKNCDVRVRWSIDAADRDKVDVKAIKALLAEVGANEVKLEGTVGQVTRVRAEGMNRLITIESKLGQWAKTIGIDSEPLLARLSMLHGATGEEVLAAVLSTLPGSKSAGQDKPDLSSTVIDDFALN